MSLRLSATFPDAARAARAMRLLRQSGVSVQMVGRAAPTRPPRPDGFDASGFYTGTPAVTALRALPHTAAPAAQVAASRTLLLLAEPRELPDVRAIVCRCGGALH